jgi:hypothetical protein
VSLDSGSGRAPDTIIEMKADNYNLIEWNGCGADGNNFVFASDDDSSLLFLDGSTMAITSYYVFTLVETLTSYY